MGISKTESSVISGLEPIVTELKAYSYDEAPAKVGFWESFQRKEDGEVKTKDLKMAHLAVIALSSGMGTGL
ncbi:hypothetical protein OXX80_013517, partial [Metschnikowia pulcherrima]